MSDVYYNPEKSGLRIIGEVSWFEPDYSFDVTVLWTDVNGGLYWADDCGCSCTTPFENFGINDLETGNFHELAAHLNSRMTEYAAPAVVELLARVQFL